jgi:hypothetical protein
VLGSERVTVGEELGPVGGVHELGDLVVDGQSTNFPRASIGQRDAE